jgi:hypothetical protein
LRQVRLRRARIRVDPADALLLLRIDRRDKLARVLLIGSGRYVLRLRQKIAIGGASLRRSR